MTTFIECFKLKISKRSFKEKTMKNATISNSFLILFFYYKNITQHSIINSMYLGFFKTTI